jgi:hypothetical protein
MKKMVDVSKAMESDFVNVDLIRDSPTKTAVFIDEGSYEPMEYQGKKYEKFNIKIEIDGKMKIYSPNKDSVSNISKVYGLNSKLWIGQAIFLRVLKLNGKDVVIGMPLQPQVQNVEK